MNSNIHFFLFVICLFSIKSIDINLTLGVELLSENHPLIITLKEPLIKELNPIDLFVVFDISASMKGDRIDQLKKALNLIIDALNYNDRLSLISFSTKAETLSELNYMNEYEKKRQKDIVADLSTFGGTYFRESIHQFLKGIRKSYSYNNGRVQSVLFITDGDGLDGTPKNLFMAEYKNNEDLDFSIYTFLIGNEGNPKHLMEFANCRDGSFYYINDLEKIKNYVLNVIGGLRKTFYKNVNVDIISLYPIAKFYENEKLSNNTYKENTNQYSFNILQFMTGHEYTYVLELKLPDDIKCGSNILSITSTYTDFNGNKYNVYKAINYNYGCIKCYREEYCRVLTAQALEKIIILRFVNQTIFDEVKRKCGDDLNKNISGVVDKILMAQKPFNHIYGINSEISLKRGGMNLWYTNEYQKELIDYYLNKKY